MPTGTPFERRELPGGDVARYVVTSHDRGDTAAGWPCFGTAVMALPARTVAPWAPGGSVVEDLGPTRCRITLGAWSWAGVAGLVATFDTDLTDLQPYELQAAARTIARRYGNA